MNQKNNKNKLYMVLMPVALLVIVVLFLLDPSRTQATNGTQSEPGRDPIIEQSLAYYFDQVGEDVDKENVEAVRKSFGCHFEIHIYDEGELVMQLGYSNGQVYEI